MNKKVAILLALASGIPLGLTACSSGGGSGGGGSFDIVSCTLGCASAGGSGQISCGIQDVFLNGEIRISFRSPVDLASVDLFSFQVTEIGTGKTPPATFLLSASDPTVLVYRPLLSFDSSGNPVFGLTSGSSYTIKLPGLAQDPGGSFITSTAGAPNAARMLCTVSASLGVLDPKPGSPTATVLVDTLTAVDEQADGAIDVLSDSKITLRFDDLMNPATLVNPVTGQSSSIQILIDPDGITADPTDQQPVLGSFTINLDQDNLETTVVFTSELGFPSGGSDPITKRKVVIKLPTSISDLGGNSLTNAGEMAFTPVVAVFPETTLSETFDDQRQEDVPTTGAPWGGGGLVAGTTGGSGRLGPLILLAGETLVLDTDNEDFAGIDPSIFDPANVIDAPAFGSVDPITDGIFEFSALRLFSGSKLRFEGSNPARVLVRGELQIAGRLDVSGADSLEHADTEIFGSSAQTPGPSGASGGDGGRLPTWINFEGVADTVVPPPPAPPPPTLAELNGAAGTGVPDPLQPGFLFGEGAGGYAWPQPGLLPDDPTTPTYDESAAHLPVDPSDLGGALWDPIQLCQTKMKGGVGGGGAFGLDGGEGKDQPIIGAGLPAIEPPHAQGGAAADFGLGILSDPDSDPRKLDPEAGFLHGGPGGGGGASHIAISGTNGQLFFDCLTVFGGTPATINSYKQHSAPAGGSGGGAAQLQSGRRTTITGVLDAGGGAGGGQDASILGTRVTGGGGGAGGAILLQTPELSVASVPGRIDIAGGAGGLGTAGSRGGAGGAGLLRIETLPPVPTADGEASKVLPDPADLAQVGATPGDIISTGDLQVATVGPSALSGAQSCWLRPEGNFFLLDFLCDTDQDPACTRSELGWDMTVLLNPGGPISYRGPNAFFGAPLEQVFGTALGAAPVLVRFQGARAIKRIDDPCNVILNGEESQIFPGSLTGWVAHPADLNDFFADPSLRPNMIRFQIVFDRSQPGFDTVVAITDLAIHVQPD